MSPSRRLALNIGIIGAVAIGGLGFVLFALPQQMKVRNAEVRGVVGDYNELSATPVIGERISYFPRAAKSIEYWCRPYWTGISGSFDISETEYLDWARTKGWRLRECQPGDCVAGPWGRARDELIERRMDGYFYKHQEFSCGGHLSRDYQIIYDRTKHRAYFWDLDGRAGPPSSD